MILSFISCPFTAIPYFALFDDAVSGREKLYQNHVEIRLFHHNELDSLDDALQKGWQKGLHAVLFADYEFGLPLMGIESERGGNLALHWFAACANPFCIPSCPTCPIRKGNLRGRCVSRPNSSSKSVRMAPSAPNR